MKHMVSSLSERELEQLCDRLLPMIGRYFGLEKPKLTTKEKAKQLGITPATLRKWVYEGRIDVCKQGVTKQSRLLFEA